MYVQKQDGWSSFRGESEDLVAAVEIKLSSDHVRYIVKPPSQIELVAFIGGIAVIYFLLGKIINHVFFRKTYVSPMMDKLF